jgi:hypothetical protein
MKKHNLPFSFPSLRLPRPSLPAMNIMTILPTFRTRLHFAGSKATIGALGIVAIGFIATIWLTYAGTTDEIIWPEAGAAYQLPSTIGERLAPDDHTPMTRSQTLQINLANGARLDKLHLKNLDLGKTGLSNAFEVNRTVGVTGAYVNVGVFTITNSSAPTLDWANMEVNTVVLGAFVDGHTQAMVLDNTMPLLVIDSDRGAGTYVAENSTVDRVLINTNGANGATIGEIIVDNVTASVGAFDFDYMKIGTLSMDNTNKFGDGTGINSASAVFNSTIKARSITDNLVDTPIKVQ